jgi:excisionase family DNA binding protein
MHTSHTRRQVAQATTRHIGSSPTPEHASSPSTRADHLQSDEETPISGDRLVFTVTEAAYLINVSRAFAYELVARGELPSIRLGRRIVIPRAGLPEVA